jgi:hypothetical protein
MVFSEANMNFPDPVKKALWENTDDLPWMESYRVAKSEILETSKKSLWSVMQSIIWDILQSTWFSEEYQSKIMGFFWWKLEAWNPGDQTEFAWLRKGITSNSEWIQWSYDKFSWILEKFTNKFNIPDWMLAKLINKEWSKWNTWAKAKWSTGFGLWQHLKGTWDDVRVVILKRDWYDIWAHWNISPESQIYATAEYLSQMNKRWSWEDAMAYYNTGPDIKNISQEKSLEYARLNPVISNLIPWVFVKDWKIVKGEESINPSSYFKAAVAYYNEKPYEIELEIFS